MLTPGVALLYLFAAVSVLPMGASSTVLAVLVINLGVDAWRGRVRREDFRRDSLLYAAIFAWKGFTRAVNTSIVDGLRVSGLWNRVPYAVISFRALRASQALTALHVLFAANTLIVVYALAQQHLDVPFLYKPLVFTDGFRLRGYYGHANQYAGVVSSVVLVNLCLGVVLDRRLLAYSPVLLAGLVLSGSRAYLLGTMVCGGVLLAVSRAPRLALRIAAAGLAAAAVLWLTVPWLPERLLEGFSLARNVRRLHFWAISWDVFLSNPVLGVGAGELQAYLEPFHRAGLIDNALQAHSLYLQELAEGGLPGFLLVAGTHVYFVWKYLTTFAQAEDPLLRGLALGVALVFVNLLVAGVFENTFGAAPVAMTVNLLMGLVEGYRTAMQSAREEAGAAGPAIDAPSDDLSAAAEPVPR